MMRRQLAVGQTPQNQLRLVQRTAEIVGRETKTSREEKVRTVTMMIRKEEKKKKKAADALRGWRKSEEMRRTCQERFLDL